MVLVRRMVSGNRQDQIFRVNRLPKFCKIDVASAFARSPKIPEVQIDIQISSGKIFVKLCLECEIPKVDFRGGIEVHISVNTAEPPEILVLQVRAIAPSVHLHGDHIFTLADKFCDIKLSGSHASLTVAHLFTIHPDIKSTLYSCKVNKDFLSIPIFRNNKLSSVGSHRVGQFIVCEVLRGFPHYIGGIFSKWKSHVSIDGLSIAFHLPVGGNFDIVPVRDIIGRFIKIQGS